MKNRRREAKKPVFKPFENPYKDNLYLDSDSICSVDSCDDIESLDLKGLKALAMRLSENISDIEDILYIDMGEYERSAFQKESAKDSVQWDRRQIQTLRVELREVNRRIKMMMNNIGAKELIVA